MLRGYMDKMHFTNYDVAKHNPFERFPPGKYIVAEADDNGEYTLHIRFDNGLGRSSVEKMELLEVVILAFKCQEILELPFGAVWFDLPNHVVDNPSLFNRHVKEMLKRNGLYWKPAKH